MDNGVTIREKAEPEWFLARDGGMWLVGQLDGRDLSPVFELGMQAQQQPGGGLQVAYSAHPMILIHTLDRWTLSAGHNSWPVKGCAVEKQIMHAITQAEAMVTAMRAASVGISLAHAMPNGRAPSKLGKIPTR